MSKAFEVALIRSLLTASAMAGSGFFAQLATGGSMRAAEIAAGVAFFGTLAIRGGVEGILDTNAANSNQSAMP
jgi:hypothetical protein